MISKNYIIKIDTTKRDQKSVCLYLQDKQIDCENGNIDIIQSIDQILKKHNLQFLHDIKQVIPNTGPGSFTGIKTGVVIANTLNWALKNNIVYKPNYGSEPNINLSKNSK